VQLVAVNVDSFGGQNKIKMEEKKIMAVITMKQLLEAGVHFGHHTRRWNPKMKEYIFGERNGVYIIDLQKTADKIEEAYAALAEIVRNNNKVIFIGTRKQIQEVIREEALRCEQYYVDKRWLGGTLTNFKTIRKSIAKLYRYEEMEADGTFEKLPKKEVGSIKKEMAKLNGFFSGIRDMITLPGAMIVVDPKTEHNAVMEARKLNIPVFGLVDTNCDPDDVDYVIPGNDDGVRAVRLIMGVLANAVIEGNGGAVEPYTLPEEEPREEDQRPQQYSSRRPRGRRTDDRAQRKPSKPRNVETETKEAKPETEVQVEVAQEEPVAVEQAEVAQEEPVAVEQAEVAQEEPVVVEQAEATQEEPKAETETEAVAEEVSEE